MFSDLNQRRVQAEELRLPAQHNIDGTLQNAKLAGAAVVRSIYVLLITIIKIIYQGVASLLNLVYNVLAAVAHGLYNAASAVVSVIWRVIAPVVHLVWRILAPVVHLVWRIIAPVVSLIYNILAPIVIGIYNVLATVALGTYRVLATVLFGLYNGLATVVLGLFKLVDSVVLGLYKGIVTVAFGLFKGLAAIGMGLFNIVSAVAPFLLAIPFIVAAGYLINNLWHKLGRLFGFYKQAAAERAIRFKQEAAALRQSNASTSAPISPSLPASASAHANAAPKRVDQVPHHIDASYHAITESSQRAAAWRNDVGIASHQELHKTQPHKAPVLTKRLEREPETPKMVDLLPQMVQPSHVASSFAPTLIETVNAPNYASLNGPSATHSTINLAPRFVDTMRTDRLVEVVPIIHRTIEQEQINHIEQHIMEMPAADRGGVIRNAPVIEETVNTTVIDEVQPIIHREVAQAQTEYVVEDLYEKVLAPAQHTRSVQKEFDGSKTQQQQQLQAELRKRLASGQAGF